MYGKLVNGDIVYVPVNYRRPNGELVMNYNIRDDLMIADGWKEVREEYTDSSEIHTESAVVDKGNYILITFHKIYEESYGEETV